MAISAKLWIYDNHPNKKGWYATLHSWDAAEGIFPGDAYWDGNKWGEKKPIFGYQGPFETSEVANAWAYEHDVEG